MWVRNLPLPGLAPGLFAKPHADASPARGFLPPRPSVTAALAGAPGFVPRGLWAPVEARGFAFGVTELSPERAREYLLRNVSPPGAAPGSVIASPSRADPDYYYHWVRDAALVMGVVTELWERENDPVEKTALERRLKDFVAFSRQNQITETPSGEAERKASGRKGPNAGDLGEPKFEVDGRAFTGAWGRPQNDGPALRALTLTRFAKGLLKAGEEEYVRKFLYDGALPAASVIKSDLEHVAREWRKTSFEPWEEVSGLHFYTRLVQRRALLEGALLAESLGDASAAAFYREQAGLLAREIPNHWDAAKGYLRASLHVDGGLDKPSQLDATTLLAALHAEGDDGFFDASDDRVLATAQRLIDVCRKIYPINRDDLPGTVIGRYPEDTFMGGNPWVLTTCALGEIYFRAAKVFSEKGVLAVTAANRDFFNHALSRGGFSERVVAGEALAKDLPKFARLISALKTAGENQIRRIYYHADPDGGLSEQIRRDNGHMHAAPHLTWSYAAFLTAVWAGKDDDEAS